MATINYKLENFEGPLDLLLYLISKHKLNINDIEIFALVTRYTEYVKEMRESDMDVASEFIEMAARLVYIKTVSLLPKKEEAQKLKEELTGELIEYAKCKEVAKELAKKTEGFDYFVRQPLVIPKDNRYKRKHSPARLLTNYLTALQKGKKLPPPIEAFGELINKKTVSVRSKISDIFKRLKNGTKCKVRELYKSSKSVSELVATFLAVLEMIRESRISIDDDDEYITIKSTDKKNKRGDNNA